MNIFVTDPSPLISAQVLPDKHIVKMPLEETQMLCTTLWHRSPKFAEKHNLYKPVHQKHPCTLWAMKNQSNYEFAWSLLGHMLYEYEDRFKKKHGCSVHYLTLQKGIELMPKGKLSPHPQCFSGLDHLKTNESMPIEAYRKFYIVDKSRFARYNYTQKPQWMEEHELKRA